MQDYAGKTNDREILYDKLLKLKGVSNDFGFIKRLYENFAAKEKYAGDLANEVFNKFVEDFKGVRSGKPSHPQDGLDFRPDAGIVGFD